MLCTLDFIEHDVLLNDRQLDFNRWDRNILHGGQKSLLQASKFVK